MSFGQDSLRKHASYKNRFAVHYYPSALLAGDISFGIEHRYKKRFAHELSFNVKTFQPKLYYFDKGYRADYLVKYYLYNGKIFRFSSNLSFEYKNIYFVNKQIDYHYRTETNQEPLVLYQSLLEDRRKTEYGLGLSFSLNFNLYKHIFAGGDIGVNFVKYKVTYNYKEILYRDPNNLRDDQLIVPSTYQKNNTAYSPLLRLKLGYSL
jgi:hypothetical protein